MKLVLVRNQSTTGAFGNKIKYTLQAQAELTEEEKNNIEKYKMGSTVLYSNLQDTGGSVVGLMARAALSTVVKIEDLVRGREFETKEIAEMIALEEQLKEACSNFKLILDTMANFGGQEVIEFD